MPSTLSESDLVVIRQRVVQDATEGRSYSRLFGLSERPGDLGIKSETALRSALDRQHVGARGLLKYDTSYLSAATLAYGISSNHPYHDGNKRTALVAMLAHLDRNGLVLSGIDHKTLTVIMENLAQSRLPLQADRKAGTRSRKQRKQKKVERLLSLPLSRSDEMVTALANLLQHHSRMRTSKRSGQMKYRQLRSLLESHGFFLEGPLPGNRMSVMKRSTSRLFPGPVHVTTIQWPGEGRDVSKGTLSSIRAKCKLEEKDGVDDAMFFDLADSVDSLVREYSGVLRRLETR